MSTERTTRPRFKLAVSSAVLSIAFIAAACASTGSMDDGIDPPPQPDTLLMPTDTFEVRR